MYIKYISLALLTVLVSACSDDDTDGTEHTGVFVDSPVANIGYKTDSRDSVTNSKGEFTYLPGEKVTFYIGEITFPPVTASAIVTPLDMSPSEGIDELTTNVLRLLQTLDTDGDPSNGIHISEGTKSGAVNNVDFTQTISAFNSHNDVISTVKGATLDIPLTELVSVDVAVAHFESTLEDLDISLGGIDKLTFETGFTAEWLNGKLLYSVYQNLENGDVNNPQWSKNFILSYKFENGKMHVAEGISTNYIVTYDYSITDEGMISYYDDFNPDNESGFIAKYRYIHFNSQNDDFIEVCHSDDREGSLGCTKTTKNHEIFFWDATKARSAFENSDFFDYTGW